MNKTPVKVLKIIQNILSPANQNHEKSANPAKKRPVTVATLLSSPLLKIDVNASSRIPDII